uniref:Serine protease n=1 Tax=Amphilophus citrinellus TaxID=61819 RepID=A0A3Q0T5L2_AMPCI
PVALSSRATLGVSRRRESSRLTQVLTAQQIKCSDENIMIQLGKADKESIVATHFPCSCIKDGECLIILCKDEKVEVKVQDFKIIHPKDHYSVFYIDTVGGLHTKRKELFKNSDVKKFKRVCVYGEKGMTVDEAVKRDGRFIDDLGYFELSDNRDPNCLTVHTQRVDKLHLREFKMRLPKNIKENDEKQQESPSNNSQKKCKSRSRSEILALAEQEGLKWMDNRFPGDLYPKALNLRKENFGKIQQAFSEVHRVKKLLELGKSVCKVSVKDICVGTGFVLFDTFILTNAHLFTGYVDGKELQQDVEVFALFDYEEPEPKSNFYFFTAENRFIDFDAELDYAVLELNPEGLLSKGTGFVLFDTFILTNAHLFKGYVEGKKLQQDVEVTAIFNYEEPQPKTNFYFFTAENRFIDFDAELDYAVLKLNPAVQVPPGLLSKFGPLPPNGEACIIGHPAGGVKQMDPTWIIETEKRRSAIDEHLRQYKNTLIIQSISDFIRKQGIKNILIGGSNVGVVTYDTFMYHGASGSPVFDGTGRVFGLHTAGFTYGFTKAVQSVIEYAHPLMIIFEKFVSNLKTSGNEKLLKRVEEAAQGNEFLTKVLKREQEDEQPMEVSESE